MQITLIKFLIVYYALQIGVCPYYCLAVAHVESRDMKRGLEFRAGRLGKSRYYGPMAIWDGCRHLRPERLENNIIAGVRALKRLPLERYNLTCTPAYKKAIRQFSKRYAANPEIRSMIAFLQQHQKPHDTPHELFRRFLELKYTSANYAQLHLGALLPAGP